MCNQASAPWPHPRLKLHAHMLTYLLVHNRKLGLAALQAPLAL